MFSGRNTKIVIKRLKYFQEHYINASTLRVNIEQIQLFFFSKINLCNSIQVGQHESKVFYKKTREYAKCKIGRKLNLIRRK